MRKTPSPQFGQLLQLFSNVEIQDLKVSLEEIDSFFFYQKRTSFFSQETVPKASLPSSVLSTKKSSSNCLAFVPIRVKKIVSCPDLYFLRVRSSVSLKDGRLVTPHVTQLKSTGKNTLNF